MLKSLEELQHAMKVLEDHVLRVEQQVERLRSQRSDRISVVEDRVNYLMNRVEREVLRRGD